MKPNAYGIVKSGKILFKHGFFQVDSEFLPAEVNAKNTAKLQAEVVKLGGVLPATFPTEGTSWDCGNDVKVMYRHPGSGKGRVQFSIVGNMIRSEVSPTSQKKVLISPSITLTSLADVAWQYLEKNWPEKRSVAWENGLEIITWDLRKDTDKKAIRSHVWVRYNEWVKETVAKRFTAREDNEPCGVSLYDIVMFMFIGNDYPIQPDGLDRPMRAAEINQTKVDLKNTISQKRSDLEARCFAKAQNASESDWQQALANIGSWVINGELFS